MTMAIREDTNELPRVYRRVHDGGFFAAEEQLQGAYDSPVVLATSNFGKGPYSRLELTQRSFVLSDFLLFSEHSLNYLQEVELFVPQQYSCNGLKFEQIVF